MIAGIILAAGGGSRFGGPKQLAELHGRPMIEYAVDAMAAVPTIDSIVVVLGAQAELVRSHADLTGTEVVVAPDWQEGMAASIRAGLAVAGDADAVVITLADQPLMTPQAISAVLDRLDSAASAVRATYDGRPGHPVAIGRDLFAGLRALEGDLGARHLLEQAEATLVECGLLGSAEDVDTREDLEAISARPEPIAYLQMRSSGGPANRRA